MKELVEKLSSYNLFNYLLPGILFSVLASKYTKYSIIQSDIVIGVFVYYFVGLVISRIGSLVIEPLLKKVSIIRFAPYADFVEASKADDKLETLSEANNTYRTFSAAFLLLLLLKLFEITSNKFPLVDRIGPLGLVFSLFIMFILSYRKQTKYISDRVNAWKKGVDSKTDPANKHIGQERKIK